MPGSPILYLKGMRILMFQLSGFYYTYVFINMCVCRCKNLQKPSALLIHPLCAVFKSKCVLSSALLAWTRSQFSGRLFEIQ